MAGKGVPITVIGYSLILLHLSVSVVADAAGGGVEEVVCPPEETCTSLGRSRCLDPRLGCGPCMAQYFMADGTTCRRYRDQETVNLDGQREGIPEIDVIMRRVEQTRRADGGSVQGLGAGQGQVVVDKTETSVKTDQQVVEPNGQTTHLEHKNVDTVEKTKPAPPAMPDSNPEGQRAIVPADDPASNEGAVVAAQQGDPVDEGALTQPDDIAMQQEVPVAHDGEILLEDWQFILIVCGCVAVGVLGIAVAFLCWYKIQTTAKAQSEAEYPAYGLTGPSAHMPSNMSNGDRKLAQSAQMYHYQHQKQQMIAMEKREKGEMQHDASDYDSEEENEDGDLTVYECPGLAPTGEMQVKNPLFTEDRHAEEAPATEEKQ